MERTRAKRQDLGDRVLVRRRPPLAWAALALLSGCWSETTTEPREPTEPADETAAARDATVLRAEAKWNASRTERGGARPDSAESALEEFDAAGLTDEELWALGVAWFGWYPEERPASLTRESMARRFHGDSRYHDYMDVDD